MHIGLIGGIGPAATDLYYRGLVDAMKARGSELDMTIVHADAPTLVQNFEARQPGMQAKSYRKVGLLGTDTVMSTKFYGGMTSADILVPDAEEIAVIHRNYVDMALSAKVTDAQRRVFFEAGRELMRRGAEVVLLGGTDLFLAFDGQVPGFETLDCAGVHIEAIAREASRKD